MEQTFKTAVAAGTFDHFHRGHGAFLRFAFAQSEKVFVAITTDVYLTTVKADAGILPFQTRRGDVEKFLWENNFASRAEIIAINDIFGPTLSPNCTFQAIVATAKTLSGAKRINQKRQERKLPPLRIAQAPFIKAVDGGELSSTRIRQGVIDRDGNLYIQPGWFGKKLLLPDFLRPTLQKPLGKLIRGRETSPQIAALVVKKLLAKEKPKSVIAVGDFVVKSFNDQDILMDLAIVDFYVKREEKFKSLFDLGFAKETPDATVENQKGTLTPMLFKAVPEAMGNLRKGKSYIIRVLGEEDLATLVVILVSPPGTHVFYGQPDEGIVQVVVTEAKKKEIKNIVLQFTS